MVSRRQIVWRRRTVWYNQTMSDETTEVMELVLRVQRAIHRSKVLHKPPAPWLFMSGLTMAQLRALMTGGDMLLPSVATCFLALDRLRCLGLID